MFPDVLLNAVKGARHPQAWAKGYLGSSVSKLNRKLMESTCWV